MNVFGLCVHSVSIPTSGPMMDHFTNVGEKGLKMVYVPEPLVRHFLTLAERNTSKSIETWAILCGKLVNTSKSWTASGALGLLVEISP